MNANKIVNKGSRKRGWLYITLCFDKWGTLDVCKAIYSGVGTVAAVAALAATLFRPKINIHNLL